MRVFFRRGAALLAVLLVGSVGLAAQPHASPRSVPTVVLVHGAWADTSSWTGVVEALQARGFVARSIANPLRSLGTDAASAAAFVRGVPGPVVLVGHSYGGSVISEAAASSPNVKALVFVDAFLPEPGESASELNGQGSILVERPEEQLFDAMAYPDGSVDLLLKREVFLQSFANDLPAESASLLWATQRVTSTSAVTTPNTAAAWKTIPSWAFISTGDHIITAASKQFMAHRAGAAVTVFDGGSHLSLISHPEAVAAVIESAAAATS